MEAQCDDPWGICLHSVRNGMEMSGCSRLGVNNWDICVCVVVWDLRLLMDVSHLALRHGMWMYGDGLWPPPAFVPCAYYTHKVWNLGRCTLKHTHPARRNKTLR